MMASRERPAARAVHVVALQLAERRVIEDVEHAEHAVHGRAQLVAHVGQEPALGLAGSLGLPRDLVEPGDGAIAVNQEIRERGAEIPDDQGHRGHTQRGLAGVAQLGNPWPPGDRAQRDRAQRQDQHRRDRAGVLALEREEGEADRDQVTALEQPGTEVLAVEEQHSIERQARAQ